MRSNTALVCCSVLCEESRANMQRELSAKAWVELRGFSDLEGKQNVGKPLHSF